MAMAAPPMGVNSRGVSNEIPIKPNFLRVFIAKRFILVNLFAFSFFGKNLVHIFCIKSLEKTISETVVIIPITEQIAVSTHPNCNAKPVNGPPANFNMLIAMTEIYLAKFMIL